MWHGSMDWWAITVEKTPQSKPGQCRGSMVQSTLLTTHPTLGPIGMAHIVGSWVHLRGTGKKIGSPDFRFYVAWVHGLVGNYCRKTPQSKPGQYRGSMVQSTWVDHTSHTGPDWNGSHSRVVGAFAGTGKKHWLAGFSILCGMGHGLVGNYCRKTPQSKPGQCRGSMVQSTWLTTHPTLGPIGMAHIVGSWVHLRAQVQKLARRIFDFMWHGSMDWWAIIVEKNTPVQTRSV